MDDLLLRRFAPRLFVNCHDSANVNLKIQDGTIATEYSNWSHMMNEICSRNWTADRGQIEETRRILLQFVDLPSTKDSNLQTVLESLCSIDFSEPSSIERFTEQLTEHVFLSSTFQNMPISLLDHVIGAIHIVVLNRIDLLMSTWFDDADKIVSESLQQSLRFPSDRNMLPHYNLFVIVATEIVAESNEFKTLFSSLEKSRSCRIFLLKCETFLDGTVQFLDDPISEFVGALSDGVAQFIRDLTIPSLQRLGTLNTITRGIASLGIAGGRFIGAGRRLFSVSEKNSPILGSTGSSPPNDLILSHRQLFDILFQVGQWEACSGMINTVLTELDQSSDAFAMYSIVKSMLKLVQSKRSEHDANVEKYIKHVLDGISIAQPATIISLCLIPKVLSSTVCSNSIKRSVIDRIHLLCDNDASLRVFFKLILAALHGEKRFQRVQFLHVIDIRKDVERMKLRNLQKLLNEWILDRLQTMQMPFKLISCWCRSIAFSAVDHSRVSDFALQTLNDCRNLQIPKDMLDHSMKNLRAPKMPSPVASFISLLELQILDLRKSDWKSAAGSILYTYIEGFLRENSAESSMATFLKSFTMPCLFGQNLSVHVDVFNSLERSLQMRSILMVLRSDRGDESILKQEFHERVDAFSNSKCVLQTSQCVPAGFYELNEIRLIFEELEVPVAIDQTKVPNLPISFHVHNAERTASLSLDNRKSVVFFNEVADITLTICNHSEHEIAGLQLISITRDNSSVKHSTKLLPSIAPKQSSSISTTIHINDLELSFAWMLWDVESQCLVDAFCWCPEIQKHIQMELAQADMNLLLVQLQNKLDRDIRSITPVIEDSNGTSFPPKWLQRIEQIAPNQSSVLAFSKRNLTCPAENLLMTMLIDGSERRFRIPLDSSEATECAFT